MLVLARKANEAVVIGGNSGFSRLLKVTVIEVRGGQVKLGFEVADDVPVHRWEVWQRICAEGFASDAIADFAVPGEADTVFQ